MKKIKLLTSILSIATLSSAVVPLVGCSKSNNVGQAECSEDVTKKGVKVKEWNIVKNKDSWFKLELPKDKVIDDIEVTIGDKTYKKQDGIKIEDDKVTIPGDKVSEDKAVIKSITLKDIVKVTSITINNGQTASVQVNKKLQLSLSVSPDNATDKSVTWKSADESKLTVDENGEVTGKAEAPDGIKVTATAKDGSNVKGECLVKVTPVAVVTLKEISIDEQSAAKLEYKVGETFSSAGLKIKLTYTDDRTETVETGFTTNYDTHAAFETTDVAPNKVVTVTYTKDGVTKDCTYGINVNNSTVATFENTTWTAINDAAVAFEGTTQDVLAMKWLCKEFSGIDYIETGTTVEDHLANFIGKTHNVTINTKEHVFRVIGINHDELSTSTTEDKKYAVFTFDAVTLLSNSSGSTLSCIRGNTNFDYTNSILRKNLTGEGSATLSWSGASEETRTALQMLPNDLTADGVIKTVNKKVGKSKGSGQAYNVTTYTDKLFPLSCTEMALSGGLTEGNKYRYWNDHNNNEDRVKNYFVSTSGFAYYLVTPDKDKSNQAYRIKSTGELISMSMGAIGVSFAFCL